LAFSTLTRRGHPRRCSSSRWNGSGSSWPS